MGNAELTELHVSLRQSVRSEAKTPPGSGSIGPMKRIRGKLLKYVNRVVVGRLGKGSETPAPTPRRTRVSRTSLLILLSPRQPKSFLPCNATCVPFLTALRRREKET